MATSVPGAHGSFLEVAAGVSPAAGFFYRARGVERVIAGIGIGLEIAAKTVKKTIRPLALAGGRVVVDHIRMPAGLSSTWVAAAPFKEQQACGQLPALPLTTAAFQAHQNGREFQTLRIFLGQGESNLPVAPCEERALCRRLRPIREVS